MFPVRDDNPQILRPVVTYGLVAANVLAWLGLQGMGAEGPLAKSVCELGLIPAEMLGTAAPGTAVSLGPRATCVLAGEPNWVTPLSSMFLHGGWLHLLGNMWFLWLFGDNVEDSMGHVRFLLFYLLCGFAAVAAQVMSQPGSTVPVVGASGAIGGVMGAYVMLYPRVHVHMLVLLGFFVTRMVVPAFFMLGYWFLIQLLGGATSLGREGGGVAFWAHVGGFVAGALAVFAFRDARLVARHPYHGWSRRR